MAVTASACPRIHGGADTASQKLPQVGIRHIRAVLDPVVMGRSLQAQIEIKLSAQTAAFEFENALRYMPQVVTAVLMTGSFDYAIRVACENSQDLMQVTEALRKHPGMSDTSTRLVLREIELPGLV